MNKPELIRWLRDCFASEHDGLPLNRFLITTPDGFRLRIVTLGTSSQWSFALMEIEDFHKNAEPGNYMIAAFFGADSTFPRRRFGIFKEQPRRHVENLVRHSTAYSEHVENLARQTPKSMLDEPLRMPTNKPTTLGDELADSAWLGKTKLTVTVDDLAALIASSIQAGHETDDAFNCAIIVAEGKKKAHPIETYIKHMDPRTRMVWREFAANIFADRIKSHKGTPANDLTSMNSKKP